MSNPVAATATHADRLVMSGQHGKQIAKELGRLGATLVLWDVNWEALDKTAKELRQSLDVRVYAYACDCSRRMEVYRVAEVVDIY